VRKFCRTFRRFIRDPEAAAVRLSLDEIDEVAATIAAGIEARHGAPAPPPDGSEAA
jgi:hypothetical protein